MTGPLLLSSVMPRENNEAVAKAYVDTLVGNAVSQADLTAALLVISGPGGTIDTRIAAALVAYLPLAGGTLTGDLVLAGAPTIALHAATKAYVDALPIDPATYDAIVAPAGGDYTSIVTACATEAAGARIFVARSTYNETADIILKDGQMLIGQNPEDTIIDFGAANRKITNPGGCTNQRVEGFTVQGSLADYAVELQGDYAIVHNCRLIGTAAGFEGVYLNGNRGTVSNCHFTGFARVTSYCIRVDDYGTVENNTIDTCAMGIYLSQYSEARGNILTTLSTRQIYIDDYCTVGGNTFNGGQEVLIGGNDSSITRNFIAGADGIQFVTTHHQIAITGNVFFASQVDYGGWVNSEDVVISGNTFINGAGVLTGGKYWTITGNSFSGTAGVELVVQSLDCVVTGNNLTNSAAAPLIDNLGVSNTVLNNSGVSFPDERAFMFMRNLSGGLIAPGDVVTLEPTASGEDVETTVIQGDEKVFGVNTVNTNAGFSGKIQTLGKCTTLKVNGTIPIAIGDFLSTHTTAKIAMKAQPGDMAFAIALEAYAVADSAGVIDANIVTPRHISNSDYAGIIAEHNAVATTILLVDAFEPVTIFGSDMPNIISASQFGSDDLLIGANGDYKISLFMSGQSTGVGKVYGWYVFTIAAESQAITGATQAAPCVLTATGHSFINGDNVKIAGIVGMTELNGQIYTVANVGVNDFELNDDNGAVINSGGYGAYGGPGTAHLATRLPAVHTHRKFAAANDTGAMAGGGIATLVLGDTLELHVKNFTDATNVLIESAQLSMIGV